MTHAAGGAVRRLPQYDNLRALSGGKMRHIIRKGLPETYLARR
jgi:hypothetical protein